MDIEKTPIEGVLLLKPKVWKDNRGYFVETWQQSRYEKIGITVPFVQDNHSCSYRGTLRGLHFQRKYPQGKLIHVSSGCIFDVVVDIRQDSPTRGQWFGVELSEENQWQVWVPPGMAHGFLVISEIAHIHYKCTDFYHPEDEGIIRWNDPTIGIQWPEIGRLILSNKDSQA